MGDMVRKLAVSSFLGVALLSGCASNPAKLVAVRPPPPTPPTVTATRPAATINANLSESEAVWHMRAALNVAALSCRTRKTLGVATAYNRMLARHKSELAAANASEVAPFQARYGTKWAAAYDTHATKLYNFFAMPAGQVQLCIAAAQVLARINTIAPDTLADYAPKALALLEVPFLTRQTIARR